MIALREDCLLMEEKGGGYLPCSVEQLTLEFVGSASEILDPEILKDAAAGVLHYFKHELGRTFVSVGEFAAALARVLERLGITAEVTQVHEASETRVLDLRQLATVAGKMGELEFFWRLRSVLREQLAQSPGRLEFHGLRSCVKQLAARRHWCPTCDQLEGWIVELIRAWYEREPASASTALVVR